LEADFSSPEAFTELSTSSNHIFFIRATNESSLSEIEECALASAARANPTRTVWLLSNAVRCDALRARIPDLRILRFAPEDVFDSVPHLARWYTSRVWDMRFRGAHLADGLRLALLWRFGGA
jgi:hypothetical protein